MGKIQKLLNQYSEEIFALVFFICVAWFIRHSVKTQVAELTTWPTEIENGQSYCGIQSYQFCKKNDWFGAHAENFSEFSIQYGNFCMQLDGSMPDARYVRHIPTSHSQTLFLCRMKDPSEI